MLVWKGLQFINSGRLDLLEYSYCNFCDLIRLWWAGKTLEVNFHFQQQLFFETPFSRGSQTFLPAFLYIRWGSFEIASSEEPIKSGCQLVLGMDGAIILQP